MYVKCSLRLLLFILLLIHRRNPLPSFFINLIFHTNYSYTNVLDYYWEGIPAIRYTVAHFLKTSEALVMKDLKLLSNKNPFIVLDGISTQEDTFRNIIYFLKWTEDNAWAYLYRPGTLVIAYLDVKAFRRLLGNERLKMSNLPYDVESFYPAMDDVNFILRILLL